MRTQGSRSMLLAPFPEVLKHLKLPIVIQSFRAFCRAYLYGWLDVWL